MVETGLYHRLIWAPPAVFRLDVNILCRLFDEQAVWQCKLSGFTSTGFEFNNGVYGWERWLKVSIWTQCGMKEILDGNRCHKLTWTLLNATANCGVHAALGPLGAHKCLTVFNSPAACRYRHSRHRDKSDYMHFWTLYWQLRFFGQASTQSPALSLCSL